MAVSEPHQGGKERPPKTRESRKQALTPQKMLKEPEDKDPDEDEDQNKKIKGEEQYIGKQGMPQSKFTYVGGGKIENSGYNIKI